jgi:MFS family permease
MPNSTDPADPTAAAEPVASPQSLPPKRSRLLANRDFLRLWSAQAISVFGSQISALAIPLVAASYLHVDAFQFALLGTIEFLPFILFALPAGAWVDRLRRRPILISGDLGRAIVLATIPVVYALNPAWLTIWQLYLVGFVAGTLTVFFDVADQSYLPSVIERDQLIEGNSRLQTSQSAAQIAGPGIAGFLVGIVTAPFAILLDSLSFVASALLVFLIRRPEPPIEDHVDASGKRPSFLAQVREGMGFVLGNRSLRGIAAGTSTSNLFGNIGGSIVLLYMVQGLNLSPAEIGIVFALGNIGTLVGALTANRVASRLGLGPTIVGSLFVGSFFPLLVAIAPASSPIPFLVLAGMLGGISQMVYNINQVSYRQAICPPRMQGRMNATMRFFVWGTIPIGNIIGGVLGTTIGLHDAIWVSAVLSFIPAIFPFLSPIRHVRVMPDQVDDEASATAASA